MTFSDKGCVLFCVGFLLLIVILYVLFIFWLKDLWFAFWG